MLMWGLSVAIAFSLGLVLAAMAVVFAWLWAAEGWGKTAALAAAMMAFLAVADVPSPGVRWRWLEPWPPTSRSVFGRIGLRRLSYRDEMQFSVRLLGPILAGGAIGGAMVIAHQILDAQAGSSYHAGARSHGAAWDAIADLVGDLAEQVFAVRDG